jgi:hypothetical protein
MTIQALLDLGMEELPLTHRLVAHEAIGLGCVRLCLRCLVACLASGACEIVTVGARHLDMTVDVRDARAGSRYDIASETRLESSIPRRLIQNARFSKRLPSDLVPRGEVARRARRSLRVLGVREAAFALGNILVTCKTAFVGNLRSLLSREARVPSQVRDDLAECRGLVQESTCEADIDVAFDALGLIDVGTGGPRLVVGLHLMAARAELGAVRVDRGAKQQRDGQDRERDPHTGPSARAACEAP